jgi:hypothetical protein
MTSPTPPTMNFDWPDWLKEIRVHRFSSNEGMTYSCDAYIHDDYAPEGSFYLGFGTTAGEAIAEATKNDHIVVHMPWPGPRK